MALYVNRKVLLSPVSETTEGLLARNYYSEYVGFGKVSEVHEAYRRLGNVAVSFVDLPDSPSCMMLSYDAELIKDEKYVIDLISYCIDLKLAGK